MAYNKKLRRHSGRVTLRFEGRKELLIEECIEPQTYWDDWRDYRDGFRSCDDRKMLRNKHMRWSSHLKISQWNNKLRILINRRKQRKKCYKKN